MAAGSKRRQSESCSAGPLLLAAAAAVTVLFCKRESGIASAANLVSLQVTFDDGARGAASARASAAGGAEPSIVGAPAVKLARPLAPEAPAPEAPAAELPAPELPAPELPAPEALPLRPEPEAAPAPPPPGTWAVDEAAERALLSRRSPGFVHIPKTAGTAVVAALDAGKLKVRQPMTMASGCRWHEPPSVHTRGGFVVLRDVLRRVVSEFCWVRQQEAFKTYKQRFGASEVWPYTCEMFNDWVLAAIKMSREDPYFPDCHMIPQWCYASMVDYWVPHGRHLESDLRQLHPNMANLSMHVENSEGMSDTPGPCVRFNITTDCINSTNMELLREHFADDFAYVQPFVDQSKAKKGQAAGDPTRYFASGRRWRLGPVAKEDFACDVEASKTLTSQAPCDLRPSSPGAAAPTCVPSMLECARLASQDEDCASVITYYGTRDGGPGGMYPGWCMCLKLSKDVGDAACPGQKTKGASVASFQRDLTQTPRTRCPKLRRP